MTSIKELLIRYLPIRDRLLSLLSASDIASFIASIGLELTASEKRLYLTIFNELGQYSERIKNHIRQGYIIFLVGNDLVKLNQKIYNPIQFYKQHGPHSQLVIGLIMF